jgi:hypothetical protein
LHFYLEQIMGRKPRDLLDELTDEYQTTLHYRVASDSWTFRGESVTPSSLSRILAGEMVTTNQSIINTMERYSFAEYQRNKALMVEWLEKVERRGVDEGPLRRWMLRMQHKDTDAMTHEANIAAMRQWIWQVKQGIMARKATWHVVPVCWCKKNGTGKTTNIKALVRPMYQFVRELKVEELDEKFSGKMLARTLVTLLDEFEGCSPAQVPIVKSIVTGKPFDKRGMMSESGFFAENRMSCIATSNKEPPHGFYDETGARRFWSIHTREEEIKPGSELFAFYKEVEKDIDALWQSVSVNAEAPTASLDPGLNKFMEDVRDAKLRSKSSLEMFMRDCTVASDDESIEMKPLLDCYKRYCDLTGLTKMRLNYEKAAEKLREFGYLVVSPGNRPEAKGRALKVEWESTNISRN